MTILSIEQIAKNLSVETTAPVAQWAFKSQFVDAKYVSIDLKQEFFVTIEVANELRSITLNEEYDLLGLEPESEEEVNAKKARRKELRATKISFEQAYQICLKEYKESLETKFFVKPVILFGKALFIEAEFRPVKNEKRDSFGLYHGHTYSHYQPFWEVFNADDLYTNLDEINEKMKDLGFFAVKSGFDYNSIEDLKEIKSLLPQDWINTYNQ